MIKKTEYRRSVLNNSIFDFEVDLYFIVGFCFVFRFFLPVVCFLLLFCFVCVCVWGGGGGGGLCVCYGAVAYKSAVHQLFFSHFISDAHSVNGGFCFTHILGPVGVAAGRQCR